MNPKAKKTKQNKTISILDNSTLDFFCVAELSLVLAWYVQDKPWFPIFPGKGGNPGTVGDRSALVLPQLPPWIVKGGQCPQPSKSALCLSEQNVDQMTANIGNKETDFLAPIPNSLWVHFLIHCY